MAKFNRLIFFIQRSNKNSHCQHSKITMARFNLSKFKTSFCFQIYSGIALVIRFKLYVYNTKKKYSESIQILKSNEKQQN